MGRRKSSVQEFLEGFTGGYTTTRQVANDYQSGKAMDAKVEEVIGEDGTKSFKLLDKTYDKAPTESEANYARNQALAGVAKRWGDPKEGMRLGMMADQQKTLDDEKAFQADSADWYKNSRSGQAATEYQAAMGEYEKSAKQYEEQVKAGANPAALGMAPKPPERPTMTYLDTLNDTAGYLDLKAKHGKMDVQAWMGVGKALGEVKKEGTIDAMRLLQAGDKDGAIAKFNESGAHKIDPADVVGFNPVKVNLDGASMDSYELLVKQKDGSIQRINALKQLDAYGKANELFDRRMKVNQDNRANAADARNAASSGRSAITFTQGQEDRQKRLSAEQEKAQAGMDLFKEQHPDATEAQLKAVKAGIIAPVDKPDANAYTPINSDIRAALEKPATYENGSPILDSTGKPAMVRDSEKERALTNFMADNGITNAKEGYAKFTAANRAKEKKEAPERQAQEDAQRFINEGSMTLEEANAILKEKGFKQLRPKSPK